jgi:imidazolonepropionase-like amidohydrolase
MSFIFRDTSAIYYIRPSIPRHQPKAQLLPQAQLDEMESIALTNVRIFDGKRIKAPSTIVISDGLIAPTLESTNASTTIDGEGGVLIPGLIDAHVHVHDLEDLACLAKHGITTALDMGTKSLEFFPSGSLRSTPVVADIRSPGLPATSADSRHGKSPHFPKHALVSGVEDTARSVSERIAEGADYIKIMVDTPGPDQATLNALVAAARKHGKLSIAHATSSQSIAMAQEAGMDVITHAPLDLALDSKAVAAMKSGGRLSVPTLIKMQGTANHSPSDNDYAAARASVAALHEAAVPILAGSDANKRSQGAAKVAYGDGLHRELELLVDAGMSSVEALRAATSEAARAFGLGDRGTIEVGMRADLVLLSGDPVEDKGYADAEAGVVSRYSV